MGVLQIASVGENPEAVFVGFRTFPVSKVVLLYTPEFEASARDISHRCDGVHVPTELRRIENEPLMACLQHVSEIVRDERSKFDDIVINTGAGPRMMTCALLASAFVNGLTSIDVMGDRAVPLPVLKFSYDELVTDAKVAILRALLDGGGEVGSLEALAERSGLEKSLLSYHIRGGRGARGLEELGLVFVDRAVQGRLVLRLTPMGRVLLLSRGPPLPAGPAPAR
jgi:DNA-binding transcriptional ArsR family regulator